MQWMLTTFKNVELYYLFFMDPWIALSRSVVSKHVPSTTAHFGCLQYWKHLIWHLHSGPPGKFVFTGWEFGIAKLFVRLLLQSLIMSWWVESGVETFKMCTVGAYRADLGSTGLDQGFPNTFQVWQLIQHVTLTMHYGYSLVTDVCSVNKGLGGSRNVVENHGSK